MIIFTSTNGMLKWFEPCPTCDPDEYEFFDTSINIKTQRTRYEQSIKLYGEVSDGD